MSRINRRTVFAFFPALLLASFAELAPASEKGATNSRQPRQGAAAEYASHAIALAKTRYWSETGFTISPNGVLEKFGGLGEKDREDARMRELSAGNPTLWKQVAPALSEKYAELQKTINRERFKAMERYRSEISRILTQLVKARGGGSSSAELYALIPAETEWVLKQMAMPQAEPISDHDFESALARSVDYLSEPGDATPASIKNAVAALRRAEQTLSGQQVASERREILRFFEN